MCRCVLFFSLQILHVGCDYRVYVYRRVWFGCVCSACSSVVRMCLQCAVVVVQSVYVARQVRYREELMWYLYIVMVIYVCT